MSENWNFDLADIPRDRRVLIAHPRDGKVYATTWVEPNKFSAKGRWSGWTECTEPVAWQHYPESFQTHPPRRSTGTSMMSIRIKIAKWLAPELVRDNHWLEDEARIWEDSASRWSEKAMRRGIALNNIKVLRTPNCAHIGKRMADIAEQALSHAPNLPTSEEG